VTSTNRANIVVKERYIDFEMFFEWKVEAGAEGRADVRAQRRH